MTRAARILLVSPRYPPALGGVERVVEMLASGLASRSFEVEVATTDPTGTSPRVERHDHLSIRRFPTLRHDDVFYLSPGLSLWLLRNVGRYDLVHAHSYHTPLALVGAIAARLHRVPFVVTPHYHGTGHTAARRLLHRPYRRLGAWMIRQAVLVLCSSEAECALIREHFGASLPTRVVEYGVDTVDVNAPDPVHGNGRTILAGGRLEAYKQIDLVVRALPHLPAQFRLVVFGDGPARAALESWAGDAGLAERVEFVGRVTDADLAHHFRTADVFVSMSREEAFGLTVLEAAAAGTPVVSSDIPAYRELAERFPAGTMHVLGVDADAASLAKAIELAATDPPPTVAASGIPTWDLMVDETLAGYRTVLAGRGRLQPERQ